MYINPFLAGILTTLLVEFVLLIVVAVLYLERNKNEKL